MAGSAVIGALRVNLSIDTASFANGLKSAEGSLKRFGNIASKGIAVAAAAFTTAAGGLALAMRGVINEADQLGKMAQSIGIPVEELSRLKHAADLSDVSLQGLATSVGRLSRNMSDVASGAGAEAKRAFDQLGIAVTNTDGSLKSSSAVMVEVAGRFGSMEDGAQKTAIALQLFGRSGMTMIPMLNAGADGLRSMMEEADKLGIVIDTKTAKAAEAFNDNLTRLGKVKDGIITKITAEMLPAFANLSQVLIDTAKNSDLVRQVANGLTMALRFVVEVAANVAVAVKSVAGEIAGLGKMGELFMQGEFRAGWAAYQQSVNDTKAAVAGLAEFTERLWSNEAFTAPAIAPMSLEPVATGLQKVGAAAKEAKIDVDKFEASAVSLERTEQQVASTLESSFVGAFDSMMDKTFSLRDALSGLFRDLARMGISTAFRAATGGLFGGGSGGSGGGGIPWSWGGFDSGLPRMKSGGSFTVSGAGGVDSKLVAFRATPGERVTVDPNGGFGGPQNVTINVNGARGNMEIRTMVAEGLLEYDRRKSREEMRAA